MKTNILSKSGLDDNRSVKRGEGGRKERKGESEGGRKREVGEGGGEIATKRRRKWGERKKGEVGGGRGVDQNYRWRGGGSFSIKNVAIVLLAPLL